MALKNVHLLRKGIWNSLQSITSTCTTCTALACCASHLTHMSCTEILTGTEEQQSIRAGKKIKQGLIFLSDKICTISHLSVKGNNLYVKYYKDHFKFLRNVSPCLHRLEPSHQLITLCSWVIMQNLLLIIYVKTEGAKFEAPMYH